MFLPSWTSLPPPSPSHPSRLLQSPGQTPGLTWVFWNLVMVLFSAMWLDAWTPKDQWLAAWKKVKVLVIQSCLSLCNPLDCSPPGASVHGILQAEYWSGLPYLSPGYLPNPALLHCRQILYYLSHQGNPWILEWVAYPFSRGSSWSRNQTGVSCITGRFFIVWATREALNLP